MKPLRVPVVICAESSEIIIRRLNRLPAVLLSLSIIPQNLEQLQYL
jgi:hypothetical protein